MPLHAFVIFAIFWSQVKMVMHQLVMSSVILRGSRPLTSKQNMTSIHEISGGKMPNGACRLPRGTDLWCVWWLPSPQFFDYQGHPPRGSHDPTRWFGRVLAPSKPVILDDKCWQIGVLRCGHPNCLAHRLRHPEAFEMATIFGFIFVVLSHI